MITEINQIEALLSNIIRWDNITEKGFYFIDFWLQGVIGLMQGAGGEVVCINKTSTMTANGSLSYEMIPIYPEPNFSVRIYCFILSGLLTVSLLGFITLHFHPRGVKERNFKTFDDINVKATGSKAKLDTEERNLEDRKLVKETKYPPSQNAHIEYNLSDLALHEATGYLSKTANDCSAEPVDSLIVSILTDLTKNEQDLKPELLSAEKPRSHSTCISIIRLNILFATFTTFWICALLYGVLLSLGSYSCLPYGNDAYNLAVRLSVISQPVACFLGMFYTMKSLLGIAACVLLGTVGAAYHIVLAFLSPFPPLQDETAGAVIAVCHTNMFCS